MNLYQRFPPIDFEKEVPPLVAHLDNGRLARYDVGIAENAPLHLLPDGEYEYVGRGRIFARDGVRYEGQQIYKFFCRRPCSFSS